MLKKIHFETKLYLDVYIIDGGASDSTWQVVDYETYLVNLEDYQNPNELPHYKKFYSASEVSSFFLYASTRLERPACKASPTPEGRMF